MISRSSLDTLAEAILGHPCVLRPANVPASLPGRGIVHLTVADEPVTVLNLAVEDVDAAVTELNAAGVVTKVYGDDTGVPTDERGVMRGRGPTIAWFRDPAGNVLSVIAAD